MKTVRLKKRKIKISPFEIICFLCLAIYALSLLYMYFWGVITSLKTNFDFRHNLFGLPQGNIWEWQWNNYVVAFNEVKVQVGARYVYLFEMLFNSFLYSFLGAFISVFCTWMVSYVCAKFKYKFSSVLYKAVIVFMIVPIVGSLPSSLKIYRDILNLYDNWFYVAISSIGINGANMMIFYGFFLGVGDAYAEAAKIDGANNWQIMLRIMFPITSQMFLILFINAFIPRWNDYMACVIWIPSIPTLAYGIYKFKDATNNVANWPPLQITACVLLMIPMLAAFIALKDTFMGNIRIGGIKG